jgi:signal transduction histidine kinase
MRPLAVRPVGSYLAVGAAAIGAYFFAPRGTVTQTVLYSLIGFYGVAGLAVGVRHLETKARLPWYLYGLGLVCFLVGDSMFDAYDIGGGTTPFPSIADGFYLLAYPVLVVATVLLLRRFGRLGSRLALLDAAALTGAFVLIQWVFLLIPAVNSGGSVFSRSISVAYPAMDVLLVAPLARLLVTSVARTASLRLLALAIVMMLIPDEVYYGRGVDHRWLDAFWLASYVLWGAAALHPSAGRLVSGEREGDPRLTQKRLALLTAAVAVAPAVLVFRAARGEDTHPYIVGVIGATVSGLVLLRIAALVRALEEARTDDRGARALAEAAQAALVEQNEKLRELDRLKDEFVGLVSHDLRTPLTSISGYVELLQSDETGALNEEQRGFLAIVARNADRLLRLINDLLFVARLQAGRLELDVSEVQVAELAEHAIATASPPAEAKGLKLTFERVGDTTVFGEADRLSQLLDNLVSNAVKFTPEGGLVSVRVVAEPDAVVIEVADSGIGIPASEQERLFDRFFRASTAVSRQIPGTGLGLHIARAIVDAHSGRIAVSSNEDLGTTFRVELPAGRVIAATHA